MADASHTREYDDEVVNVTNRVSHLSLPEDEPLVRSLTPNRRADIAMALASSPDKTIGAVEESIVEESLEHDFWLARWRGIQVLRESCGKDDERAVLLLIERTKDPMIEVVVAALQTLGELCTRGNELVTPSILPLLGHGTWNVRHATVECLEKVACLADEGVFPSVLHLVGDDDAQTRLAAMKSMHVLGAPKDPRIVAAGVRGLEDPVEENREAAVALLKQFSHRGESDVVKGLDRMCMHDASQALRHLAASSLGHWAAHALEQSTSSMLVRQLGSQDREIGRSAVVGMLTRLRSKDASVRGTALRSLTEGLSTREATRLSMAARGGGAVQ
uniref:TOG domain-containing protein n=1 Tax=Hemiselmis andersenii TaxID=464988 RepID=A0A6U4RQL0_HEMAN|mmetsp:Transcript_33133/g.77589  ORF Transcript_33133/g.77589 Transcript_33133/m.77589 type:complete len:332 (+) Transcript_33133:33-1028(+)